ncbi:MAG: hypothetical protein EOP48_10095, partial [Sphingobacteriales bacterium]
MVKINIGGELTAGEILLLAAFPLYIGRYQKVIKIPEVAKITCLGLLYLMSLIISDIFRNTTLVDCLRGWSKVGLMIFAIPLLGALYGGREKRLAAYFFGLMCSPFLKIALYGYEVDIYKFFIGYPISTLAFYFAGNKKIAFGRILPLAAGVLAFIMNSRSLAGITFVSGLFNFMNSSKEKLSSVSQKKVILNIVIISLSALIVAQMYTLAAPQGWLGEAAREKFIAQSSESSTGEFSVLSGRPELFFSFPKIIEPPLIGHGSWARDEDFYVSRSRELGLRISESVRERGLIPTHSHFFGAWVEAGLLGAFFWLIIAFKIAESLLKGRLNRYRSLAPIVIFLMINFFWEIWFSPFG